MDNRIDQLFKRRLGTAVSAEVPSNKSATLDALAKSKRGFRLWVLLPLLLLIGAAGWAVYHFQLKNENSHRVAATKPAQNETPLARVISKRESNGETTVSNGITATDQTITISTATKKEAFHAKGSEVVFEKDIRRINGVLNEQMITESGKGQEDISKSTSASVPGIFDTAPIQSELTLDIPNDHSVSPVWMKNGVFDLDVNPNRSFTPLKTPTPIWTLTARGIVGGAVPVFGNAESVGGQLRETYESTGLSYGAELGIERTFGKWRVGSGIGSMTISTKVNYPSINQETEITVDSTMWTTFINTYFEVDSTFNPLLGNWNYDTTYFSELDSIGTDTSWIELAQIANGTLQRANGQTTISVITIPLQLQYKLFETDRFGSLHALGGVQWVYAYRRRGYYVTPDGEGLVGIAEDPGFKRMNVHFNIGLDWRYPLTDQLFTSIQPVLNYSVLDWQRGYDQRFVTPMLKFGLGWRLK
ncbi:MAG: hypothetical protein ACOYLH_03625 [Flavobacteriales bacterium]